MITRGVIVKTAVFVLVAVLGIAYVLTEYVGVGAKLFGRQYTVYVDMADSGGLFTTASVTYRGIEIGRVGTISLRPGGIRVALDITSGPKIPQQVRAVVGDGSPIGEQFIDLRPTSDDMSHVLHNGSVVPQSMTSLPVNSQDVLLSLDRLVNSVPKRQLHDLVNELGTAFDDTGPALQRLLDSAHTLVQAAQGDLPKTVGLLDSSRTVLDTQNDLSNDIVAFSRQLSQFSDSLRGSDTDLRRLIRNGVPAATQLTDLVHGIDATLPITLGNLTTVGQIAAVRIPAIRQVLIIYPYVVATSYGLFPMNQSTRFGVPIPPSNSSQPCTQGYIAKSKRRLPTDLKYPKLRYDSFCKAPANSQTGARGARMAPGPNGKRLIQDPSYVNNDGVRGGSGGSSSGSSAAGSGSDGGTAAAIATTSSTQSFTTPDGHRYTLGSTGGQQRVMGDDSWKWLVFGPMS